MKQTATLTSLSGSFGTSVKIILTLLFLNFLTQSISAQTIKIDGLANSAPAGLGEWCQPALTHIQDGFGNGVAEDQYTEGSKDFMYAADWRWSISQTKGKNDLANVSAGIIPAGTVIKADGSVAPGGPFLVFAGDRLSNNGDAQIGFWFFQSGTAPVVQPDGTQNFAPPKTIVGGPALGDMLVLADFTGGGRDGTVTVLEWVGSGGNYAASSAFNLLTLQAAVAENNLNTTPIPSCFDYPDDEYATNAFFEGYVNLAEVTGSGQGVCFARVQLEGRSSQEITASLDDFVGGPLGSVPNCSIAGSNTICAGSSTCFTATGGSGSFTYNWSGPGGYTATGAVICNVSVGGSYTVTVSNATGCTSGCSRTLTVNTAPVCGITGNNTICSYQSASFTASGGASYSWSGPGGYTNTGAVISNLTAAGIYNVTVTSAASCTSTCSRELFVNPPPSCSVTGNNTICSGGSASFTASGGGTYAWTGPGGYTAGNVSVISGLTAAGTYRVTVTSAAGCTSTCSRDLVVNNTPTCSITGNNTICSYQSASFTASGGNSYVWSGPGGFTGSSAIVSSLTAAGTYNVTVTASGGCTSTCSRELFVNPPPSCNITGNNTICVGQSASFTATGGTGYSWTGPAGFSASGAIISSLTAAGTYNVTVTSAAGCTSTCSRTLTVNQTPSVNAGTDPAAQCREASIIENVLVFGTNTFSVSGSVNAFTTPNTPAWTVQSNTTGYTVLIVSPNSLTTNVQISGNDKNGGSVTLRLSGTSNATPSCGPATDDVTLVLNPRPLLKQVIGSDFCPNVTSTGSVRLFNSENGVSYQLRDDAPSNVQDPQIGNGGTLTWTGLGNGSYTVVGTFVATTCNTTAGPANVVENPVQEVSITPLAQLCNDHEPVPIIASILGGIFSGTGVVGNTFNPAGLAPGPYTITYTFENLQHCISTAEIQVTVVSCAAQICTYTQGAYGSEGGKSCDGENDGLTTVELINQSLGNWPGASLKIGVSQLLPTNIQNYVLINDADAACIIATMPGGGPAKEVTGVNQICSLPPNMLKNGRIHNVLLAQTIALALNIGISPPDLGDFPLQAGTLYTAEPDGGCGSSVPKLRECNYDPITHLLLPVVNEYTSRSFSQALIDAIEDAGYPKTVSGLFALANDAIGNKDGVNGSEQGLSLSEIAGGAGSINEVFDECRISVGWNIGACPPSDAPPPARITVSTNAEGATIGNLKVSTYPNPYRNNVRFVVQSPVSGQAILEVYNIAGQKIQTVFKGHMEANETRNIDYKPTVPNGMLIYTLRIGTKQVTGKLVGITQ